MPVTSNSFAVARFDGRCLRVPFATMFLLAGSGRRLAQVEPIGGAIPDASRATIEQGWRVFRAVYLLKPGQRARCRLTVKSAGSAARSWPKSVAQTDVPGAKDFRHRHDGAPWPGR